jgi:hypothetical protein
MFSRVATVTVATLNLLKDLQVLFLIRLIILLFQEKNPQALEQAFNVNSTLKVPCEKSYFFSL